MNIATKDVSASETAISGSSKKYRYISYITYTQSPCAAGSARQFTFTSILQLSQTLREKLVDRPACDSKVNIVVLLFTILDWLNTS